MCGVDSVVVMGGCGGGVGMGGWVEECVLLVVGVKVGWGYGKD